MPDIRVEGAENFGKLADHLREVGMKDLRKDLYAAIGRAVKPLTADVKGSTKYFLPGRFAVELSRSLRVRARTRAGRNPTIRLVGSAKTKGRKERDLASLNRGRLRHPLFGDRRHWFDQPVKAGWWDEPLKEEAVEVVRDELEKVVDDIRRKLQSY